MTPNDNMTTEVISLTNLYIIRHAQAEANLLRLFHGHVDGKLTDYGKECLAPLAKRFNGIAIDAVYSSDLTRARLTAEAIAQSQSLPVFTTPKLREIYAGRWEGMKFADCQETFKEQFTLFLSADFNCRPEEGESIREVAERMKAAIDDILAHHKDETVVIVSHGCAIRSYLTLICGCTELGKNTAVSKLEFDNEGNVTPAFLWDLSHLV